MPTIASNECPYEVGGDESMGLFCMVRWFSADQKEPNSFVSESMFKLYVWQNFGATFTNVEMESLKENTFPACVICESVLPSQHTCHKDMIEAPK